jgi:predicted Zn-dependent protease DUF2268
MRSLLAASLLLLSPLRLAAQHHAPDSARVVTSDIDHFWRAYDRAARARTYRDTLRAYFEEYYLEASPGLRDFIHSRIGSEYELVETVRRHPGYYRAMRPATAVVAAAAPAVRRVFTKWKALYPDAVFPDVYFLVGRMSSGGTTSADKILIGAEMYGRTAETPDSELDAWHRAVTRRPDSVAAIIAHELIHVNQRDEGDRVTLLEAALREGSADFLGSLLSGENINDRLASWAGPREKDLWREFRQEMHGTELSHWLFQGSQAQADGRPADLGYYIGYRITEAYYRQAPDKVKAIGEILKLDDPDALLAASGYAARLEGP